MIKYLLDTNIVIYVMKKRPIELMGIFNENANRMAISSITFSELQYGAEKSARVSENLNAIEEFTSLIDILPYTAKASMHYGNIRAGLESLGQTIGVNDLHIAAHARSEGLVLVTNNMSEFTRVPGLLLENWVSAS
jgi:tRNA(fMet)-specific endonuclease VapC